MKFLVAQLATETNTFTGWPTGMAGFEEYGVHRGNASTLDPLGFGSYMVAMRALIERDGHQMVESLSAIAQPGGRTVRAVYEHLRDVILDDATQALPLDAVLLHLHGAMAADGYDDCEGDLIARMRAIVGPAVPIAVEVDLHCHYTRLMAESADVIVAYKEYPHIDIIERAADIYRVAVDAARGRVRPTTASFDCKMVGLWHTTREPMKSFVGRMKALEGKDGVLSVSFGHGFPWGDVPQAGAKVWVTTDADPAKARALAQRLGLELWNLREATLTPFIGIDAALDQVLARDAGLTVLADVADNPGGGAPGDSTFILRRLVERGIRCAAIGMFWDLGAIHVCRQAGVGAHIDLRIGGKCGPESGAPVDLRVTVRSVVEQHRQYAWDMHIPLGPSVWVQTDEGIDIALASVRGQVFSPDAFTGLGIDLTTKKMVVVKSTQHFHAGFSPLASSILYVSTPGALRPDFASIPYTKRALDYWPRVADPHDVHP